MNSNLVNTSGRSKILLLFLIVVLILGGLLLGRGVWWPWQKVELTASISLSSDEEAPVVVYETQEVYEKWKGERPSVTAEIDLEKWAGQLLRVDIEGVVARPGAKDKPVGVAGCVAKVVDENGAHFIEFAGWQNEGSPPFHPGSIGSPAFVVPGEKESSLVYSESGSLWHVLRVPEKASLQVTLSPVLKKELHEPPTPVIPSTGLLQLTKKNLQNSGNKRPPDVFIYLIDALRADHLGCYGYKRPTSPAIDKFARQATLYEEAFVTATWTRSSISSLFTGLYPSAHRVIRVEGEASKMGEWPTLLAEALKSVDYKTFAVVSMINVSELFGLTQGLDETIFREKGSPAWANSQVAELLKKHDRERPLLIFLHTVEPHSPYEAEPQTARRFDRGFRGSCDGTEEAFDAAGNTYPKLSAEDIAYLIDLYDGEIADSDTGFAGFLDLLQRHDRYDNSIIILLADHGESFAEHDALRHGYTLNRPEMRIPLIIRYPGGQWAGLRIKERVSMVDLFPTIMAQAGNNPKLPYPLLGTDLAGLTEAAPAKPSRRIYGEVSHFAPNTIDLITVIDEDGYKRVINLAPKELSEATEKSVGLWDTKTDTKEQVDLIESLPVRAAYTEQLLAHWLAFQNYIYLSASSGEMPAVEMTEELREQLKALGYLD